MGFITTMVNYGAYVWLVSFLVSFSLQIILFRHELYLPTSFQQDVMAVINFDDPNVATLALGSQARQGLIRV
jgi:hypothetical protein